VKTKRTSRSAEIIVETDEILVLKGSLGAIRQHCPACRREVAAVSPEQAAKLLGVSTRTIYRWVEASTLHFTEDCGRVRVCVPALSLRAAGTQANA